MEKQLGIKDIWQHNRGKYNIALIIAGFLGFMSYCIVGSIVIPSPYFEVTIFTTLFQGIMYLFMMGLANIGYVVLMYLDQSINKSNLDSLSHKIIYYGYFGISCFLPFSISILLYIFYHDGYPEELMYYNNLP